MTDYSELKRLVAQGSLPQVVATLIAENERLKVLAQSEIGNASEGAKEVMGARMTLHALEQERVKLKAENDALRKDAERYRFIKLDEQMDLVEDLNYNVQGVKWDAEIDAAMAKEGAHG